MCSCFQGLTVTGLQYFTDEAIPSLQDHTMSIYRTAVYRALWSIWEWQPKTRDSQLH